MGFIRRWIVRVMYEYFEEGRNRFLRYAALAVCYFYLQSLRWERDRAERLAEDVGIDQGRIELLIKMLGGNFN